MEYSFVEGMEQISADEAFELLKTTYWANKRSREQVEKSMRNSVCYGIRLAEGRKLAGFARVITDWATTYYLCDVVIDEAYRGKGLGKALVSHIVSLPEYAGKTAYFGGIKNARFRRKVVPGDVLDLSVEIEAVKGPVGTGKAVAKVGGQTAVTAELMLAIGM